jgi:hypothetical protein
MCSARTSRVVITDSKTPNLWRHLTIIISPMLGVVTSIYIHQNRYHFNTDTIYTDSKLYYTRKGTFVTNLHYVFIYYILDNLIWLYFPPSPIEKSNRPIVYHVVRLPMRFKQGERWVESQSAHVFWVEHTLRYHFNTDTIYTDSKLYYTHTKNQA